ncbi:hypothetical protein GGQ74_002959 [Desulfobaculum xiamenense]|uniref:Uncharacterized protein n=1 Tax=Desulfobaculum xiamenense TaxID=995050 RepID=A0A846QRV9_9BACT|nr:hypothetical protein [Desulfobaculum xiamenense]NJB69262.1 hypothetical protein [Desulfobaculum xiamenense]
MATKKLIVGGYTESRCSRCKDITNHVIAAMVNGEVIKVQCCACGSMHKHRPPVVPRTETGATVVKRSGGKVSPVRKPGAIEPSAAAPRGASATRSTTRRSSASRTPAVDSEAVRKLWERALVARSHREPKPYSMETAYNVDDVVEHTKFGTGYVCELVETDKVKIMFQCGEKLLRCAMRQVA